MKELIFQKGLEECMISHYWCFKDKGYKYEPYVCHEP